MKFFKIDNWNQIAWCDIFENRHSLKFHNLVCEIFIISKILMKIGKGLPLVDLGHQAFQVNFYSCCCHARYSRQLEMDSRLVKRVLMSFRSGLPAWLILCRLGLNFLSVDNWCCVYQKCTALDSRNQRDDYLRCKFAVLRAIQKLVEFNLNLIETPHL